MQFFKMLRVMVGKKLIFDFLVYVLFYTSAVIFFIPDSVAREEGRCSIFSDDSLYFKARNLAHSGETEKALEAALILLERNPLHHDASVLAARLYSWERQFDSARYYIKNVTDHHPGYHDAMSALIDIEIWDGNYLQAVEAAENALSFHPGDEEFMFKKARGLFYGEMISEATEILE